MPSTSHTIHGARKITFKTEVVTPSSEPKKKYAWTKLRVDDGADSEITEISLFNCNGLVIEDADQLDVFFVKSTDGKTRLEISLPDSVLGVEDVERTDAKILPFTTPAKKEE